ncbi:MAG: hypothetical protein VKI81_05380 [Synechococcaceae cyanobacterium]|nr:hypothetical protein [Synechococcaceae cyanobacterium]
MKEVNPVPDSPIPASVSYRELAAWLRQAPAETEPTVTAPSPADAAAADPTLEALFAGWERTSRELLEVLQRGGDSLGRGRSPRQMMALGALQAHLLMALQAHAASSRRKE